MGAACSQGMATLPGLSKPSAAATAAVAAPSAAASSASRAAAQFPVALRAPAKKRKVRGEYELGALLGKGGYSSVRLATHQPTGETRALKIVEKRGRDEADSFHREADIAKRMAHPNVVGFFGSFDDAGHSYLAMELAVGGELFKRIITLRRFSEDKAAVVMRQLMRAVEYMQSVDVAHRDLKPENLVLSSSGPVDAEWNVMKVIDFGFACDAKEDTVMTSRVGTYCYMAPQVARGSYDRRCDVWSAGVVMYVLLSGRFPITCNNLRAVREGSWSMAGQVWERVSPAAKQLLRSLMRVEVEARATPGDALCSLWLAEDLEPDVRLLPSLGPTAGYASAAASTASPSESRASSATSECTTMQ